jgi:hypothetical protein
MAAELSTTAAGRLFANCDVLIVRSGIGANKMFTRHLSFFAALLLSAPAGAKPAFDHPADASDVETRIMRAKEIIEKLDQPQDYGGVTRDDADPNRLSWINFTNFANFANFSNFRNFQNFQNFHNFQNFRNFQNFQNFHNAPQVNVAPRPSVVAPPRPVVVEPPRPVVVAPPRPVVVEPPRPAFVAPPRPVVVTPTPVHPNPPAVGTSISPHLGQPGSAGPVSRPLPGLGSPPAAGATPAAPVGAMAHPEPRPIPLAPPTAALPAPGSAGPMAHPEPKPLPLLEHHPLKPPGEPTPSIAGPIPHVDPKPFRPVVPRPTHLPPRIPHHEPRPFPVVPGTFVRLLPAYPVLVVPDALAIAAADATSDPLADLTYGFDEIQNQSPDAVAVPVVAAPSEAVGEATAATPSVLPSRPPARPPGIDITADSDTAGPATAQRPGAAAQLKDEQDITAYVNNAISRYQKESENFVNIVRSARDEFKKLEQDDTASLQNRQPLLQNFGYAAVYGASGAAGDAAVPASGDAADAYWQVLRHSMETAHTLSAVLDRIEDFTKEIAGDVRPKLDQLLAVFRRLEK